MIVIYRGGAYIIRIKDQYVGCKQYVVFEVVGILHSLLRGEIVLGVGLDLIPRLGGFMFALKHHRVVEIISSIKIYAGSDYVARGKGCNIAG